MGIWIVTKHRPPQRKKVAGIRKLGWGIEHLLLDRQNKRNSWNNINAKFTMLRRKCPQGLRGVRKNNVQTSL